MDKSEKIIFTFVFIFLAFLLGCTLYIGIKEIVHPKIEIKQCK